MRIGQVTKMTYDKFCNIMRKSRLLSKVSVINSDRQYCIIDRKCPERKVIIAPSDNGGVTVAFNKVGIGSYPFKSLHLTLSANAVFDIPPQEMQTSIDVNILLHWAISECFLGKPERPLLKRMWIKMIRTWQHFLIRFRH